MRPDGIAKRIVTGADYRRTLEAWVPAARQHLYRLPAAPGCICYGPGHHGHWALQASQTALAAFAVLATDPATDPAVTGMSRDELLDTALGMLRFALQGHQSGAGACTDGQRWGNSWISALCLERAMHAVEALGPHLSADDAASLRRVLIAESDWLLDHYEVAAGTVENNRPESNMWNGALLQRTALMYPDAARAAEYREKGLRFLVNAISVPADAHDEAVLDGRPVRERHVGANFFPSYACNHHGYLNVGYMVITLSNAAMLHFSYRARGLEAPQALYRHIAELWQLVKTCTFADGRLLRIGGDTRVRYCYCQDYAIPVWLMMRDRYGEAEVEALEQGWLAQVRTESAANGDGSFLGERLAPMAAVSPLYYTRLEGDRAASLSMGAYWRRRYDEFAAAPAAAKPAPVLSLWHDDYHGACLVRGPARVASWVWRAAEPPQGLCLAPAHSNMAEWRTNLAGRISGTGLVTTARTAAHSEALYAEAFATCGRVIVQTAQHYAEGELADDIAVEDIAFAALPDGRTVVALQRARATHRVLLTEVKGLLLQVPNDVYNGGRRRYEGAAGRVEARAARGPAETRDLGRWLSVDDRLGVLALGAAGPLQLYRPGHRQVTICNASWKLRAQFGEGLFGADEVCLGACATGLSWYEADASLFDVAFAVRTACGGRDAAAWAAAQERCPVTLGAASAPDVRAAVVLGADGHAYGLVANFAAQEAEVCLAVTGAARVAALRPGLAASLAGGALRLPLGPFGAELLHLMP